MRAQSINAPLPYIDSAAASWTACKIVLDHLRHRYAYPAWALGFRSFEFFDRTRSVWESYDDIVEACCVAWNWLIADTDRVSSITTREWASVIT